MPASYPEQMLPVLLLVALLVATRRLWKPYAGSVADALRQLVDELTDRRPVYSAETTRRREALFVRDQLLRKRRSFVLISLAVLALVVVLGWFLLGR